MDLKLTNKVSKRLAVRNSCRDLTEILAAEILIYLAEISPRFLTIPGLGIATANAVPRPGLEPRPLDPKSSAPLIRPPRLPGLRLVYFGSVKLF